MRSAESRWRVTSRCPRAIWAVLASLLALAPPAFACPDCVEGRAARSQVWQDGFAQNLVVALLPFLLIGAISARAEAIGRRPTTRQRESST